MAIALAEADKYEILEKIGMSCHIRPLHCCLELNIYIVLSGCGSFGIIRKVKRKSDGFVSALALVDVKLIKMSNCVADIMSQRDQLHQDVPEGAGATHG